MEELAEKAKRNDRQAFVHLMEDLGQNLYKVAKTMLKSDEDAVDAMQETVLTCWEKVGTLKENRYFKTWATRICINHCNEILRMRKRTVSQEVLPEPVMTEDGFCNAEWDVFLQILEEKYRILLYLHYVEGYTTKEIAQTLDLNESTVRGRLATARDRIRKQLRHEPFVSASADRKAGQIPKGGKVCHILTR